jgi:RNA polymerase sigma-70 factor, ECF subfamily
VFWKGERQHADAVVVFDADHTAVEAARRDPLRFEALYRKYVGQVYNFAVYELGNHHAAEDVTEQVFLAALAALPRFRESGAVPGASSFRVWLFQIARNALSNERRTTRRRPSVPLDAISSLPDAALPAAEDPADAAVRRDTARRAWRAVSHLPADRRRAIVLRFVEEMSPSEIGGILGRSEGAVRVLIHRALRAVAADLRRDSDPDARTAARTRRR